MIKRLRIIEGLGSLFLMLLISSCSSSYQTLLIETPHPSSNILPSEIRSLTLMNRSLTNEFMDYDTDSLQQFFFTRGFNFDSVVLDSLIADSTLIALGQLLYESGRYDVVIPEERNLARDRRFYLLDDKLDWDEVKRICETFETDALLVLERYYMKISTKYQVYSTPEGEPVYASASIDSKYDAVVRIYDPINESIVSQMVVDDTISWYEEDNSTKRLFRRLPTIKNALTETGIQIALDLDDKLSPIWKKESRIFFVLEKTDEIRITQMAKENRWQEIYDYWETYSNASQKSTKSKAEFNLALASEMLGAIDQAIEWATKSYNTRYMLQTENYLLQLKKQKERISRMN